MVHTYSSLLHTYNASEAREGEEGGRGGKEEEEGEEGREVAEIWQLVSAYLLGEQMLSDAAWEMVCVLLSISRVSFTCCISNVHNIGYNLLIIVKPKMPDVYIVSTVMSVTCTA